MNKLITVPVIAITLSLAAAAPAQANPYAGNLSLTSNPFSVLIGMLLPAVQKVREAA